MVVITAVPLLPASSMKLILKLADPFGVLLATVCTACQSVPFPLVAVVVDPASVTVGTGIGSLEVKKRVRLSPDFARFVDTLFEASETLLKVGTVVSKLTLLLLVVSPVSYTHLTLPTKRIV